MMLKLGDYSFEINTAAYEQLIRVHNYRWPAQERLGRSPAHQYTGPGDITIELSGTLYPQKLEDLKQLNHMRAQADKGAALQLVDGLGFVHGSWCILTVREENSSFTQEGVPLKINFNLSLVRYGNDA